MNHVGAIEADGEADAETDPFLSSSNIGRDDIDIIETQGVAASSPDVLTEKIFLRVAAAMLSFFILGLHTSARGVLIPYMEPFYKVNDTLISLLFVTPFIGYLAASSINNFIHIKFGRRGIAFIGSVCQLVSNIIIAFHPPYAIILIFFSLFGFSAGLIDPGWCAFVAGLPNANTISGFLHSSYSAGGMVGPGFTASLFVAAGLPWYSFYWVMAAVSIVQVFVLTGAFRHDTAIKRHSVSTRLDNDVESNSHLKAVWRYKVVWICAAYLVAYVGVENAIGGWIVLLMIRVRGASTSIASICATGYWIGMAVGRVLLGPVTDRFGERLSVTIYLIAAMAAGAVFCIFTPIAFAIGSITMVGFFFGPLFPTAIVVLVRLLPKRLHVGAVVTVAAIGQIGGAVFPFIVGALADKLGIQALQPFVFVLLLSSFAIWQCFPRPPDQKHDLRDVRFDGDPDIPRL